MEKCTNVVLICCNRLLRESIARILSKRIEFRVLATPVLESSPVRELASINADVVVLDSLQSLGEDSIFAPDRRESRVIKCLLIAMADNRESFLAGIRRGVLGYVLQDASATEVVTAVRAVAHGQAVCPVRYALVLFNYFALQTTGAPNRGRRVLLGLTRREQQLVPLIDHGMTNKEIACHLHLSEQTIKNHIHRILRKLGVQDRLSIFEAFQTQILPVQ